MKCYNCGSKLHKESNYCHVCGTELSKEEKLLLNLEDSNNDESDNKSDNDKIINFDVLKYKLRRVFIESKDIPNAKESETETLGEIVDDDEVITEPLENDDFQFNVNYNPSKVEEAAPVNEIESEEVEPSFFDKIKHKINSNSDIKESDTEDIQYYDSNAIDISKINTKTQEKPSFFNQFKSNRMDSEEIADEIIESDIENVELSNESPSDKEKGFFTTILSGLKSFINEDDEEYNFFELFSGKDSEIDEEGLSKSQLNEDVEPIDTALMKEEIIDDEELILSEDGFETNNENFIEEVTHQEDLSLEDIVVEDDFTNNESNDEHKQ
ncbi:MAG: zinc ribbon domain-containing protein [Tissierellia bacterium]|nr:zinc ribbon domain-containing protein [Tissierellia bacterium]